MVNIVDEQVERIREQVGDGPGHLRAVRRRRLRRGRRDRAARHRRPAHLRVRRPRDDAARARPSRSSATSRPSSAPLDVVDAADQFLDALAGVSDPEEKRKIIGREFIRTFEAAEVRVFGDLGASEGGDVAYLVQGTLYPDVVESGGGAGTSNIKSHHNVGGLPDDLAVRADRAAAHPLQGRGARRSASSSACRRTMVWRHPFPGPGLGIRIIGEVDRERLDILRGPTRSPARS